MNIKNENGITLISLAVTIVVLTILASIVISASVGDNGLIDETRIATIKASIREVEEAIDTHILLKEKGKIQSGNLEKVTLDELVGDILSEESDQDGYNMYKINLQKLNIKGDYGKGTTTDVFKLKEKDGIYEVIYVYDDGTIYTK